MTTANKWPGVITSIKLGGVELLESEVNAVLTRALLEAPPEPTTTLAPLRFEVTGYIRHNDCPRGHYRLVLEATVIDRRNGEPLALTFSQGFANFTPEADALRQLLGMAMSHEIDECILVNGKRPFDPHPAEMIFETEFKFAPDERDT